MDPYIPLAHEIRTLDNLMMRNFMIRMHATGLDEMTVMHGWILGFLEQREGQDVYQRDIEAEFYIGRSTVTNILQRMEGKGLIRRQSVDCDARLKKLELTPLGRQVLVCMRPVVMEVDRQLRQGIPEEELEAFRETLRKLRGNALCCAGNQETIL